MRKRGKKIRNSEGKRKLREMKYGKVRSKGKMRKCKGKRELEGKEACKGETK